MSRKKKGKPAAPAGHGPVAQAGEADKGVGAARYKEAIEHFKELLKRERRPEWLAGLAAAYAGRAEQLAAKDMVKEALALWRTRADACGVPLLGGSGGSGGPYVSWLLKCGQVDQALGLMSAVDKLPAAERALAHTQLAAAMLAAPETQLARVPEENPLRLHLAAARAALAACVSGDTQALAEALQAISFRSPYRDLRALLKALSLRASDPAAAAAALARVPAAGPFEGLAKAVRVSLMAGTEWLAGLRRLDAAGRALALDLAGCPPSQHPLVFDLMGLAGDGAVASPALLDLLLRHRRALVGDRMRSLYLRLLPHAPQRLDAFRTGFAPMVPTEQERVLALAAELKMQHEQAQTHWLRLVKLLGAQPAGQQRAALVLRRLAGDRHHCDPDGQLDPQALAWLDQSLKLDPTDCDTHLRLVRDARRCGDLRQARTWLEAARKHFPDAAPLLQEAVEIALAAGSYKKAAGLAKQVLQVDPINPRVRTLIGQAHLSHARKLIDARKPQAALREIDEAALWVRDAGERARVKLLRGLATEPGSAGDALLRDAVAELGGPLVGAFHLLCECSPSWSVQQDVLRRAGVDPTAAPGTAQVLELARVLNTQPRRNATLRAALAALRGALDGAAGSLQFDNEGQHLQVCEALYRQGLVDLTSSFAQAALRRWPQRPEFIYFEVAAQFDGHPERMPQRDWRRLEQAFDRARDRGDQRTAARLGQLMDAASCGPPGFNLPDQDDTDGGGVRAVMEMILALGGEDRFLEMARKQLGKATFDELRRDIKGSKKDLARALVGLMDMADPDPDFDAGPKVLPPQPAARPRKSPVPKHSPATGKQPDLFDDLFDD